MKIKVVRLEDVEESHLGGGSWTKELLSGKTVGMKKMMLGVSTLKPGGEFKPRIHEEEEVVYVIKGKGVIQSDAEKIEITEDMALYIPPGVKHGVVNTGTEDLVQLYAFSFPRYPPTKTAES